jgi:hypothetical protein
MKKVVLLALVLAVCGMLHNAVLAQDVPRYRVTYIKSQTTGRPSDTRSATVITVVNQHSSSCSARVEWFNQDGTSACSSAAVPLNAGEAVQFCSRTLPGGISACNNVALCRLPSNISGTAVVYSSPLVVQGGCNRIAVEARVYYLGTNAAGTAGDTPVTAISNSRVVFIGEANLGD